MTVRLRPVIDTDLPTFFVQQLDPEAIRMAAFTVENPSDRAAFDAHWARVRTAELILLFTVLADEEVAGYIVSFVRFGLREVGYWYGREFWGRGIATEALRQFLRLERTRPLHARVAIDHAASLRVVEKQGFERLTIERAFASGRGEDTDEHLLALFPADRG